jgi:hypothetical protein
VATVSKVELAAALSQPVKKEEEKETETTVAPSDKDSGAADAEGEGDANEECEEEPSWPPRGITIIAGPSGDMPGSYRYYLVYVIIGTVLM